MRAEPPLYPAFLNLRGARVLVVGAGAVALRKTRDVLDAGAVVTVVAPEFARAFQALAARNSTLTLHVRPYRASDLKGARLVFAATNRPELNREICAAAQARGIWVNCAAPPSAGDLVLAASLRYGHLCVSFSTGGASAALAAALKRKLSQVIGPEWGQLVALLRQKRTRALAEVRDETVRRALLLKLGDPAWAGRLKNLGRAEVSGRMDRLIKQATKKNA